MILAIETSCDETAIACLDGTTVLSTRLASQIRHHRAYGGVVPELASRLHAETIHRLLTECLEDAQITMQDITAIATTVGPGLEGALLVGAMCANTLAMRHDIPLIPINHLHGHM